MFVLLFSNWHLVIWDICALGVEDFFSFCAMLHLRICAFGHLCIWTFVHLDICAFGHLDICAFEIGSSKRPFVFLAAAFHFCLLCFAFCFYFALLCLAFCFYFYFGFALLAKAERLARSAVKPVEPVVKRRVVVDDTVRLAKELAGEIGGPSRKPAQKCVLFVGVR